MKETPFFFPNGSYNLFGILHDPEVQPNSRGFVFCHPFAEEKLWAHRVFVNFARILAQKGYHVLRFDYMGHGDSEGEFSDSSVETRLADIQAAVGWLQANRPVEAGTGLLGLRFGATLACLASEKQQRITPLVLWEPVIHGGRYMKEMLRINISTQAAVYREIRQNSEALVEQMKAGGTANIDGYEMGWAMYEQASSINLLDGVRGFDGPTLVVEINRRSTGETTRLTSLAEMFRRGKLSEAIEEPFWKEIKSYYAKAQDLFRVTLDWLESA
jgi:exosortase A-associated hydrolase 2